MAEWQAHSLRYLGLSTTGVPLARWTHSPVPLQYGVLKEMRDALQARHRKPWMEAIIDGSRITEYTTYGVYARYIDQLRRVKHTGRGCVSTTGGAPRPRRWGKTSPGVSATNAARWC